MTTDADREERFWRRLIIWSAVGSALILLLFRCDYRNGARFDHEKWRSYTSDPHAGWPEECTRGAMVSDLQSRYLRPGVEQKTVEALLGPADFEGRTKKTCREYILGMCSGLQMDFDGLFVCYDADGGLTESYTVQH